LKRVPTIKRCTKASPSQERLEDRIDVEEARKTLREMQEKGDDDCFVFFSLPPSVGATNEELAERVVKKPRLVVQFTDIQKM